jgi:hypothetical protein
MRTLQRIFYYFILKPKTRISLAIFYLILSLYGVYFFYNRSSFNFFALEQLIENYGMDPKYNLIKIEPYCKCRKEILVKEYFDNIYLVDKTIIYYNATLSKEDAKKQLSFVDFLKNIFSISSENVFVNPKFTCNLYSELRHGPGKKVISYSLYGTHVGYYHLIDTIGNMSLEFFNDWIIRVHYDNSIKKEIICENECKHDHMYFCNVHETPFKSISTVNLFKSNNNEIKNDMAYVHGRFYFTVVQFFLKQIKPIAYSLKKV